MVRRLTQPMKSIRTLMRYLKIVTEDFLAMVMHTGCKFKSNSLMNVRAYDETGTEEEQKEKNKDISSPRLNGDGIYKNVTGFHTRLGIDTTYVTGNCETAHVMFRYAEGLLCYAEAAAELGLYNDGVAEKTLKPLRQRAGVAYVTPAAESSLPFPRPAAGSAGGTSGKTLRAISARFSFG